MEALKEEMRRMVEKEIPIMKDTLTTDDAVKLFHDLGMTDKERLFRYRRNTSYLKYFDVQIYGNGFVLMFPNENTKEVADFTPSAKHFETLKESSKWGQTMGIGTVGALNDAIASGRMQEIIMVQEALMEQRIGQLANQIKNAGSK